MLKLTACRLPVAVIFAAVLALSCSVPDKVRKQVFKGRNSGATGGTAKYGKSKTSKPYKIDGVKYYPIESSKGFTQKGIASWYGPDFHGKATANGETYDQMEMTAAHKTLPFNTVLIVKNLDNGKSTKVRVNDRGPFVGDRIIDLSKAAAIDIGMIAKGTARVKLKAASGGSERRYRPSPKRYKAKEDVKEAETEKSVAAKPAPSTSASVYYVQAGSFSDPQKAEDFKSAFNGEYGKVSIKKKRFFTGSVHRILLGPYSDRETAEKAARSINGKRAVKGAFVITDP